MADDVPDPRRDATDRQVVLDMITGSWRSQLVRTLAELGVAELLHAGPRSAAEIAAAVDADSHAVFRLLRAAVSVGLAADDGTGQRFASTPLLDLLRARAPDSVRELAMSWAAPGMWLLWGRLPDVIRSGHDQSLAVFGEPLWDYYSAHPDEATSFTLGLSELSGPIIREAVDAITADPGQTVVDLGGATGSFVLTILERRPGTVGVVLELPHAIEPARAEITARSMDDRCTAVAGDFFESVPPADVYLLKFVLHDWDDDACISLLSRCREAMNPGARVLVVDMLVGPVADPGPAALLDLDMLALVPGREHDLADLEKFFASAGLRSARSTALTPPYWIIEAVADERR